MARSGLGLKVLVASGIALWSASIRPAAARDGDFSNAALQSRLSRGLPSRIRLDPPSSRLYLGLDTGIEIWDTAASPPRLLGSAYLKAPAFDIAVAGNRVYVADGEQGLVVLDVTTPATITVAGQWATTSVTRGVDVQGGFAYLAEAGGAAALDRLVVVDLANLTGPPGLVMLPNGALSVTVAGSRAYVGLGEDLAGPKGVQLVDVTVPLAPVAGALLATSKAVEAIVLGPANGYAATGVGAAGELVTFRLSPPAVIATLAVAAGLHDLSLQGATLFAAAGPIGVATFSLGNPAQPFRVGSVPSAREIVTVDAGVAMTYMGDRSSSGTAALYSFPTVAAGPPAVLVTYSEATDAAAQTAMGYFLRRERLDIFNTTLPNAPVLKAFYAPPGADFSAIDVLGTVAAIAEGTTVHLVTVPDTPASIVVPALIRSFDVQSGVAIRSVLSGGEVYVVTGRGVEKYDRAIAGPPLGTFSTAVIASDLAIDATAATGYLVAGNTVYTLDLATMTSLSSLVLSGEELYGVAVLPAFRLLVVTGLDLTAQLIDLATLPPTKKGFLRDGSGFRTRIYQDGTRVFVAGGDRGLRILDTSNRNLPTVGPPEPGASA